MLPEFHLQQTNRPLEVLRHWRRDKGGLLLDPPYQRGDVWGTKRRQNFIRSILLGVPIPSLIINDRSGADWKNDTRIAVIDGRQRITTVLMFFDCMFSVPGDWFGLDRKEVFFDELREVQQRRFENRPIPFSEGRLKTLKDEQMVFELVNFGGLAQGETDIS